MDPDDLYALPLERFTAERNALARKLRNGGDRDEAARVSRLRKPSVAAWAVNQLVRTQKREVAALLEAGDRLVAVQEDLLAGQAKAGGLRDAVEAERAAADTLLERARGLLSADGAELPPQRLEQVRETLNAAALDPDARAEVAAGCLVKELQHVGLGSLAASGEPGDSGGRAAPRAPAGRAAPREAARRKAAKVQSAKLRAARQAAAEAERRLGRTERDVRGAEDKRDRAQSQLRASEDELAAAVAAHKAALQEHERAQRALKRTDG